MIASIAARECSDAAAVTALARRLRARRRGRGGSSRLLRVWITDSISLSVDCATCDCLMWTASRAFSERSRMDETSSRAAARAIVRATIASAHFLALWDERNRGGVRRAGPTIEQNVPAAPAPKIIPTPHPHKHPSHPPACTVVRVSSSHRSDPRCVAWCVAHDLPCTPPMPTTQGMQMSEGSEPLITPHSPRKSPHRSHDE